MDLRPDMIGDETDNPFNVLRRHSHAGVGAAFTQPIQPQRTIRIDHDLDDHGIGQCFGDRRPHRRAQHGAASTEGDGVGAGHAASSWTVSMSLVSVPAIRRPT